MIQPSTLTKSASVDDISYFQHLSSFPFLCLFILCWPSSSLAFLLPKIFETVSFISSDSFLDCYEEETTSSNWSSSEASLIWSSDASLRSSLLFYYLRGSSTFYWISYYYFWVSSFYGADIWTVSRWAEAYFLTYSLTFFL